MIVSNYCNVRGSYFVLICNNCGKKAKRIFNSLKYANRFIKSKSNGWQIIHHAHKSIEVHFCLDCLRMKTRMDIGEMHKDNKKYKQIKLDFIETKTIKCKDCIDGVVITLNENWFGYTEYGLKLRNVRMERCNACNGSGFVKP